MSLWFIPGDCYLMTLTGKQNLAIKKAINDCLDEGITDKILIYNCVEKKLNCPRPTIRRVCKIVRDDMQNRLDILRVTPNGSTSEFRKKKKSKKDIQNAIQ